MNKKGIIAVISLLIISTIVFASGFIALGLKYNVFEKVVNRFTGTPSISDKEMKYLVETSLYDVYPNRKANIVMLGDSITFGVNWNELLGRNDIVNRGIGSDTTDGILNRMEYIYETNPRICFVLVGINDLRYGRSVEDTFENYKKIITNLQNQNITPIIQSVLYTSEKYKGYKELNKKVTSLNKLLFNYSEESNISYVDLNKTLANGTELKEEYTYDGLHLLGNGYSVWREEIVAYIAKLEH